MKTAGFLMSFLFVLFCNASFSQNIFDPLDSLVTYDSISLAGSVQNPNQPAWNTIGKWVRTPRVDWNSSNFKSYIFNGMQFRLRFPDNYNPLNADKYPVIIFFHGGGEVGSIYDNEVQLLWGAGPFEKRINNSEWNGFMLFPQEPVIGWNDFHFSRLNTILDTLEKYNNTDRDRIISMGLSAGGFGALSYASHYPQRIATVVAASPIQSVSLIPSLPNWIQIPVWFANGGMDLNPDPITTQDFYTAFRNTGGNIFQSYFATDGHNTWVDMWDMRDKAWRLMTTTYWNSASKSQPLLYFQHAQFCDNEPIVARMGITEGFFAYEWDKDGSVIAGAVSNEYIATQTGSYRVRFKRSSTAEWSAWTPKPVIITKKTCAVDTIYAEHFTADNDYNASLPYTKANFGAQNGILTSGTTRFTQDAAGVQGGRFMVNFTDSAKGYVYANGDMIWSNANPIAVLPNTVYEYSFWLGNQNDTAPAKIVPSINGMPLVSDSLSSSGVGNTSWTKFAYQWNSGNATTAILSLLNKESKTSGNDFVIDEISLRKITVLAAPSCGTIIAPANGSLLDSMNAADLKWHASPTATSYDLYLWTGDSVPGVPTINTPDTLYHSSGLLPGTLYHWYVAPRNATGAASGCANDYAAQFTTASLPVPACVNNISPANAAVLETQTIATLRWTASANTGSYDVYLWTGTERPATPIANITDTSYQAAALLAATSYNWYIVPRNNSGAATGCETTTTSQFTTAAVVIPVPSCAVNMTPLDADTVSSSTSATLTWSAAPNADSYEVYIWAGSNMTSLPVAIVDSNSYTVTDLLPATTYHWYISPKNASGAAIGCGNTNASSFTTAAVVVPVPLCSVNLSPEDGTTIASQTSASLSWDISPTASSYDVYLWTGINIPTVPLASVSGTSYDTSGLLPGTTYHWYINPRNASGVATGCAVNSISSFTTSNIPISIPGCVANLLPLNNNSLATQHSAALSWQASPAATSYDVYVWTGTNIPITPFANITDTIYNVSDLSAATTYNWFIVPKNAGGAAAGCIINNLFSFTTAAEPLLAPGCTVNVAPSNGVLLKTITGITLKWAAVDNADSYDVYVWTGQTMPAIPRANVQTTAYEVNDLSAATAYHWLIIPRNTAGGAYECAAANTSIFTTASNPNLQDDSDNNPSNEVEPDTLRSMRLYPNPSSQGQQIHLKVYSKTGGRARIIIRNATGAMVLNTTAQVRAGINDCVVQSFALTAGFYIFFIDGDISTRGNLKVIVR